MTGRFNVIDDLHIITGGRYNKWQARGESYGTEQHADYSKFIPYLGTVYRFMPELAAYASYTETYVEQTEKNASGKFLDPITGESREIGLKSELFDGSLIASLAYFDVTQTNLATLDLNTKDLPPNLQQYYGSDGINSKGFELDIAGEIYTGLNTSIGFTHFDITGDEVVKNYTPSKLFKLAATYEIPMIEGLTVGANLRWQDTISRDQGVVAAGFVNAGSQIITTQKAYSVVDLMASYNFTDYLGLALNANNITNKKYLNSLYWAQSYYGAPANYSATLTWKL